MKPFLTKTISDSVLDVDDKSRRVKVVIARMGNEDRDKEIITEGAFTKTIKERGPMGSNEVWHLIDHHASISKALGKFTELYVEGDQLIGVNDSIVKNTLGDDVLALYKDGHINQHSIGFSIPKDRIEKKDGVTLIKEVQIWEGSAVLWGANPMTPTLSVGKSLIDLEENSTNFSERIEKLILSLRKGNYSEDLFSIMALELKILQTELQKSTTPEPASTLPDVNEERELSDQLFYLTVKHFSNGTNRGSKSPRFQNR